MGASFDQRDKHWLKNNLPVGDKPTVDEQNQLKNVFDLETKQDILEVEALAIETKYLRRLALYKFVLFIPELMLVKVLFGKDYVSNKIALTKLFWAFYKGRLTAKVFKLRYTELLEAGKLV